MTDEFDVEPEVHGSEERELDAAASGRAVDALRAALAARAAGVDVAPLDPAEFVLRARVLADSSAGGSATEANLDAGSADVDAPVDLAVRRRRRPMLAALAALVVLVLGVPLGMVLQRTSSGPTIGAARAQPATVASAGSEVPSTWAAEGGPADTKAAGAGTGTSAGGDPAPAPLRDGYRYESFLDVVIQVPASWGYAVAVGGDWCASGERRYTKAASPFVALDPMEWGQAAILCAGGVPDAMQAEHVEWARASASDVAGERTVNGWAYTSRVVGSALITYVHRPGVDAGVLASAVEVAVDHNGCPVVAPGGTASARPSPVTPAGAPTSGVLCEYLDQPEGSGPNLVTSTALDAAAASALLARIEAGTEVAGKLPDADCVPTPDATPAVVARFAVGGVVREIWLSGGCGVPTFDDGATVRRATRLGCTSIYAPPLARGSWNAAVAAVCKP